MIQPKLKPDPDSNKYILLKDYLFEYGNLSFTIRKKFSFDGASIPKIAWQITFTPFAPDVMVPAMIHDFMYVFCPVDKEMADKMFYDNLILNGANSWKAKVMYRAVKWFGKGNFKLP